MNDKKLLDYSMSLVIFLVSVLEIISWFKPDVNNQAKIIDYGDKYLTFWYPLFTTLELFVFGLFFLFKAFRYASCLNTKIISILFLSTQTITLINVIFPYSLSLYINLTQPIILSVILFLTLLNFIKWCQK